MDQKGRYVRMGYLAGGQRCPDLDSRCRRNARSAIGTWLSGISWARSKSSSRSELLMLDSTTGHIQARYSENPR